MASPERWTHVRLEDAAEEEAKEPIITEGTLDEMRDDLERLVALLEVNHLNRILGLVSGGQHLSTQDN